VAFSLKHSPTGIPIHLGDSPRIQPQIMCLPTASVAQVAELVLLLSHVGTTAVVCWNNCCRYPELVLSHVGTGAVACRNHCKDDRNWRFRYPEPLLSLLGSSAKVSGTSAVACWNGRCCVSDQVQTERELVLSPPGTDAKSSRHERELCRNDAGGWWNAVERSRTECRKLLGACNWTLGVGALEESGDLGCLFTVHPLLLLLPARRSKFCPQCAEEPG
jgi:hypothetical protein